MLPIVLALILACQVAFTLLHPRYRYRRSRSASRVHSAVDRTVVAVAIAAHHFLFLTIAIAFRWTLTFSLRRIKSAEMTILVSSFWTVRAR